MLVENIFEHHRPHQRRAGRVHAAGGAERLGRAGGGALPATSWRTASIVIDGPAEKLAATTPTCASSTSAWAGGEDDVSFRDIKHYKRRKRWLS
jgi:hypothetical protein